VTLDGSPLPRASWNQPEPVDAGPHTVAATARGKKPFEAKVVLEDAKRVTVRVPDLEDTPSPAPAPVAVGAGQRRAAFIVGGVGVAGLVVGAVAGLVSISKHDTAKRICQDNNACPDAQGRSDWDAATNAGNVSTVGFIAGGVGLAAAVILFVTAPSPRVTASARGISLRF
jgi:hypothetical protein